MKVAPPGQNGLFVVLFVPSFGCFATLGLVAQDGKHPAKILQNFRWIPGEYLDLPFSEYTPENRNERRRLQPDAVLEIPSQRARFFIEIETGSATIWDQEKVTSTLAKLNRYSLFFRGYAGNVHHGDSSTFYSRAFADDWPAEVLFVTMGAHRRDSIKKAYEKWKAARGGEELEVRAMTLEQVRAELYRKIHGFEPGDGHAKAGLKQPGASKRNHSAHQQFGGTSKARPSRSTRRATRCCRRLSARRLPSDGSDAEADAGCKTGRAANAKRRPATEGFPSLRRPRPKGSCCSRAQRSAVSARRMLHSRWSFRFASTVMSRALSSAVPMSAIIG